MSTTGITSWAVDLKDVGAIYPFQGTETILVIVGLATWIIWHIWEIVWEKNYHKKQIARYGESKAISQALDEE